MLPDKDIKCHRTSFQKTCLECVTEHGCRLWKRVTLENHPETKAPVDHYDCVDSLIDLYLKDMLRRQLQTTATVDKVASTVKEGNEAELVKAVADSREIVEMRRQVVAAVEAMRVAQEQMTITMLPAPNGRAPLMIEQD